MSSFFELPLRDDIQPMNTLEELTSGQLAGATRVSLSCGLQSFPSELFSLRDSLEILDLSGNELSSLPDSLPDLKRLRIVFLSRNPFTSFPGVLSECTELEMIGMKSCQIAEIPERAFPPKLRWLTLTDNQIPRIPTSIRHCRRLQKVMFAGNRLESLPSEMAECKNIELLRLSANHLAALPDWVLGLPRLSWLAFAGNPFCPTPVLAKEIRTLAWSDLRIQETLGQGASGVIYRALWDDRAVAVKVFKGSVTSDGMPEDEAAAYKVVGNHPNLVKLMAQVSDHPEGRTVLVFELIPSHYKNLGQPPSFETCTRDVFSPEQKLAPAEQVNILKGVVGALLRMHEKGVHHGDLYAHNILVDGEGRPLLGDFGAAGYYGVHERTLADRLPTLEARAFGCLVEDVVSLSPDEDRSSSVVRGLKELAEACCLDEPDQRPSLEEIRIRLLGT